MKIAVISDLHLGRGDLSDIFRHDDAEFLRFLNFLESNFERVVLLGDIYETLKSPRFLGQIDELKAVKNAHREIADRFQRPCYQYVHGNHDLVAANIDQAPEEYMLRVDDTRILFTHGHLHDWGKRPIRWVGETGVWLGGWLMRVGLYPVVRFFEKVDHVLMGVSPNPGRCSFQKWAVELARQRDADIVVTGHTHVGIRAEHQDRLFLNSGSCSKGHFSFLSLDTGTGTYAHSCTW
jgi:predicted phosphodiesterase